MSSMLDPEVQPSPAREIMHKGKGCLAVIVAAAVLIFGGYFVWDKATGFVSAFGEVPDYPGPGSAKVTVDVPDRLLAGRDRRHPDRRRRGQVDQGLGPGGPLRGAGAERPGRQLRDEDARCGRSTRCGC